MSEATGIGLIVPSATFSWNVSSLDSIASDGGWGVASACGATLFSVGISILLVFVRLVEM